MLHLIVKAKKLTLSVVSLSLLTAMSCGIIDTEQVTDIIEKQQEVERIRAERIDPLLDQISLVENDTIEPIERQISDLEREREIIFSGQWKKLKDRRCKKWSKCLETLECRKEH